MEPYSSPWRGVTQRAKVAAKECGHDYIAPVHLLLCIAMAPTTMAGYILGKLGITPTQLINEAEWRLAPPTNGYRTDFPLTLSARAVVRVAHEYRAKTGHRATGTLHLLLAFLKVDGTLAQDILKHFAITYEKIDAIQHGLVQERSLPPGQHDQLIEWGPLHELWRSILLLGEQERRLCGHPFLTPEHCLLAIIRHDVGLATQVLRVAGIDLGNLAAVLTDAAAAAKPDQLDSLPTIFSEALYIARHMCFVDPGTDSFLLAILTDPDFSTAHVLESCGITYANVLRIASQHPARAVQIHSRSEVASAEPSLALPHTSEWKLVMRQARKECSKVGAKEIQPEHICLAMLRVAGSRASLILRECGVPFSELSAAIAALLPSRHAPYAGPPQLSKESGKAISVAQAGAEELMSRHIGTEHLLLALASMEELAIARALAAVGVKAEIIRGKARATMSDTSEPYLSRCGGPTRQITQLVNLAREETAGLNRSPLSPAHLLLALIKHDIGRGARLIREHVQNLDAFRHDLVQSCAKPEGKPFDHLSESVKVLTAIDALASEMNEVNAGTEFLLLALLSDEQFGLKNLLHKHGLTAEAIRVEIAKGI